MTRLAQLIAQREGFGIPGTVPTRDNNPGDLRHSNHSSHPGDPNAIGVIDTVADGWADLEHQLSLYAARGLNVGQMVAEYAPASENDSAAYLAFICDGLPCDPGTSVADALLIPAETTA